MNQPAPAWDIRPYRPGDEHELVALFAQVFGRPITVEYWRWKLKALPALAENVWVAYALADGRLVAQYVGTPVQLKLAGAVGPAIIVVDTMTAPDFRRRGILSKLGQAALDSWAAAGVTCALGLPNEQLGSRKDALGWNKLFPLAWRRTFLHTEHALAARAPRPLAGPVAALAGLGTAAWHSAHRPRRHARLRVEALAQGSADLDQLWERLSLHYDNLIVRDSAWVAWRYLDAPGFAYRVLVAWDHNTMLGYVAYRLAEAQQRRTGIIADLFTAPDDRAAADTLLTAALDELWSCGAESARVTATPGSPLDALLGAAGFRAAPGAFDFDIIPFPACPPLEPLRDPGRWLVAGGDFDVV